MHRRKRFSIKSLPVATRPYKQVEPDLVDVSPELALA
jgi:hypothetical protein